MHPDVPRWAREVLEREVVDVPFTDFHVLKDGAVQKLAVGRTQRETYVVQRTPAGGELYRVATGNGHVDEHAAASAPTVACRACGTAFRYLRGNGRGGPTYCFNCGAAVSVDAQEEAALSEGERAARIQ